MKVAQSSYCVNGSTYSEFQSVRHSHTFSLSFGRRCCWAGYAGQGLAQRYITRRAGRLAGTQGLPPAIVAGRPFASSQIPGAKGSTKGTRHLKSRMDALVLCGSVLCDGRLHLL